VPGAAVAFAALLPAKEDAMSTNATTRSGQPDYPRRLSLKKRRSVQVRPMTPDDAAALHAFFLAIPEGDLLFLRRDVTDRAVIDGWARDVADGMTLTLLAERDGRVVGEASVHRSRVPWTAHVGEVRVVVDAEHRALGLGTALVQAIFLEALGLGLEKLVAEMTPDQKGAITVFQKLGFRIEGMMQNHVRDRAGQKRDLVVMAHEVHSGAEQLETLGVTEAMGR
jgi:L-amino acid N-acyltransferase YncA